MLYIVIESVAVKCHDFFYGWVPPSNFRLSDDKQKNRSSKANEESGITNVITLQICLSDLLASVIADFQRWWR